jgi:deoxyribodipyrimidine photolyase-related protein
VSSANLFVILPNQLFSPAFLKKAAGAAGFTVYLREDRQLLTYQRFHLQRISFYMRALRSYAQELEDEKIDVLFQSLDHDKDAYEEALIKLIRKRKIQKVFLFEIEDKFIERRILLRLESEKIDVSYINSPMFLTSRDQFTQYLQSVKKPFMKTFYESQRKRMKILVDKDLNPVGDRWSFDTENRLPLPASMAPPQRPEVNADRIAQEVASLCKSEFTKHPGSADLLWLPSTRQGARLWLNDFIKNKLGLFGPYEDALAPHSDFVYHSVLTPFLNSGLLTPDEVIRAALSQAKKEDIPLASLEGFIRQVIGWREFIRGIYRHHSETQDRANFWGHSKKLSPLWYKANTGVPQLDLTLKKVLQYGYCHHIERLMVLGNLMLLLEVKPVTAHNWFMEMFIDSSDWVMGPNVYGMSLFSDGGIFATKPYICGSNYWRKMSKAKEDESSLGVDGLYWGFIEKHQDFFSRNPRLSMMASTAKKMDAQKKKNLRQAADRLRERLTV